MSAKSTINNAIGRGFLHPIQKKYLINQQIDKENAKNYQLTQKKIQKNHILQPPRLSLRKISTNIIYRDEQALVCLKSASQEKFYEFPCFDDDIMDFSKIYGPTLVSHNIDNDCVTDAEQIKSACKQLHRSLELTLETQ